MEIDPAHTAVVFIDPQNDVLSESGRSWPVVGASVVENGTIEHMDAIFRAAKSRGYPVFISPHYFYPTDYSWLSTVRSKRRRSAHACFTAPAP